MLYRKFIILSITCTLRTDRIRYSAIPFFIKKQFSNLNFMQLSYSTIESLNNIKSLNVSNYDNNQISLELLKYLQNINTEFREKIVQHYLTLNLNKIDPYLINNEISKQFVALIKDDLLKNMTYVIELNPGYGLITQNLLKAGVPFIHLWESHNEFHSELQNLENIFPNRVKITKANLLKMSKMLNLNKAYESHTLNTSNRHINELFNNISKRKWEDKSCMQIIGVSTKYRFIRHLIISTIFQTGFMMYGRTIFYLALSPSIWSKMTCHGSGSSTNYIMFNMLFNYTVLGTLDRKGFLPWQKIRNLNNKNKNILQNDNELFYLVKIEPRPDLFTLFGEKEHLIYFWHFVRHHLYKPSSRVIPTLEKIMPGFGVKLIEMNYNIFTQFKELNFNQIFDIYMEFKSWPGFKQSSFLSSANDILETYEPYKEGDN